MILFEQILSYSNIKVLGFRCTHLICLFDLTIWLLFIASTFITQITFLNMLIAIMGDTYDRVSENKD